MERYYIRYSAPNRSYSVIDRERRNDFGDPYVVTPLVTEREAREIADRLNSELAFRSVFDEVVTNNPNMA